MNENRRIIASFGEAALLSLAPAMHNAAFAAASLNWSYIPFRADAATLPALFGRLKSEALAGADFTYPCEEAAVALCDGLSAEAELLKAATGTRVRGDEVEGFNANVDGFARALEELAVDVTAKDALVLGAGAPARACGLALERARASVTYATGELTRPRPGLSTRATVIRAEDAGSFLAAKRPALLVDAAASPEDGPVLFDFDAVPSGCFVYDVNCGRPSRILEAAAERGLPHADGVTLLLHAGARAFELWTGREAPLAIMRRAVTTEIAKRKM